jgi:hypothetical protein
MLCLVRDLIFSSRISATARALGVAVKMLRDPAALGAKAGSRLIADLNQAGVIDAAAEWKRRTGGQVIGFVSHVDAETIARARAAGLDRVLARSAFVESLEQILTGT